MGLPTPTLVRAIGWHFGLDRGAASVVAALYLAGGDAVTPGGLALLTRLTPSSVKTRISEARQAMRCEAVDTRGKRYALTEVGMAEVRAALLEIADELLELAEIEGAAEGCRPLVSPTVMVAERLAMAA